VLILLKPVDPDSRNVVH